MSLDATDTDALDREALAKGLLSTDSSRRVGWAKAFEHGRRADSYEAQVHVLTDENDLLRQAYCHVVGFLMGFSPDLTGPAAELLKNHRDAVQTFMKHEYGAGLRIGLEAKWTMQGVDKEDRRIKLIRHQAWRENRAAMFRTLNAGARTQGHRTRVRPVKDGASVFCTCGERIQQVSEREAHNWNNDHLAQHGFDCSFKDYKQMWKDQHAEPTDGC